MKEYMTYEGVQYYKYGKNWFFNGQKVSMDLMGELEIEYLKQFKSV